MFVEFYVGYVNRYVINFLKIYIWVVYAKVSGWALREIRNVAD